MVRDESEAVRTVEDEFAFHRLEFPGSEDEVYPLPRRIAWTDVGVRRGESGARIFRTTGGISVAKSECAFQDRPDGSGARFVVEIAGQNNRIQIRSRRELVDSVESLSHLCPALS